MLSDNDRGALADLERRIHLSDPGFAARMSRAEARFPTLAMLCVVLFVLVPPVTLLFGRPGLLVTVHLFLAAVAAVLIHRRRGVR